MAPQKSMPRTMKANAMLIAVSLKPPRRAGRTAERCVGRYVLAIQDTTVLRSERGRGEYLHAVLALD
ncbi:hypothetical protein I6F14_23530 [Bradyrhizobium sp. IC3069]|nr:hypothetical protein [Bradyrhizobium sp. IC4059]MCA1520920.1 hypothetical protein [Bradyrhizobium sp. IC3069]